MSTDSQTPGRLGGVQLLRIIGSGGYGNVWLGLDGVDTPVAIKVIDRRVLKAEAMSREEQAMRLFRDGLCEHPNLIALRHVGAEGELFFYSMDLADPQDPEAEAPGDGYRPTTLQSLLAPSVPLPIDECVAICNQLLAGIEHLHLKGVVHRDLKPSNVLRVGGLWKLADFGLATLDKTELTTVGTLGYLAPNGPMGQSGDLYAIGKILYSMLTGQSVSEFPSVAQGYAKSQERVRFGRVLRVVNHACHHLPERRFETAEEFRASLARAADRSRVVMRRRLKLAGVCAGIAISAFAAGRVFSDGPPLKVGSEIRVLTAPIEFQRSNAWEEARVLDSRGGKPLVAVIHDEAVWELEDGGNGHLYRSMLVTPDADQWSVYDARRIAEEMGGYLVALNTLEENEWVFNRLASDRALWRSLVDPISPISTGDEWKREQENLYSPEFDEEAQSYYDDYLKPLWGGLDFRSGVFMVPCTRGPIIGLQWLRGKGVWDDGDVLDPENQMWASGPSKFTFTKQSSGLNRNRRAQTHEAFGYYCIGSGEPTPTWYPAEWSNRPLQEMRNGYIAFIVEIPVAVK